MPATSYVVYIVVGGSVAVLAAVFVGLYLALARAAWPPERRRSVWRNTSLILFAWFGAALVLSWSEFFHTGRDHVPTIEIGVFVPILVGGIALRRSGMLGRIVDAVPQTWLVGVQVFRVIGAIFLIVLAAGRLPAEFALPAGTGDVLVGISALPVAFMYARDPDANAFLVRVWNAFGILDLVVAIGTGFLTSPSRFQMLSFDDPNRLASAFPLVMIPVFVVPIAILLHMMSLMKLRRARMGVISAPSAAFPVR